MIRVWSSIRFEGLIVWGALGSRAWVSEFKTLGRPSAGFEPAQHQGDQPKR